MIKKRLVDHRVVLDCCPICGGNPEPVYKATRDFVPVWWRQFCRKCDLEVMTENLKDILFSFGPGCLKLFQTSEEDFYLDEQELERRLKLRAFE